MPTTLYNPAPIQAMTPPADLRTMDHPPQPPPTVRPTPPRQRMQGANAGYLLFAGALLGLGLGALTDRWYDSSPTGLVVGFFIGTGAGLYHMIREGTRG